MKKSVNIRVKKDRDFDTIYVQDYGDDHHYNSNDNKLEMQARSLLSQYTNINQYEEALEVYKKYMHMLYEKYGGKDKYKLFKDNDLIDDFIPNRPELKMTKDIKVQRKYGIKNYGCMKKLSPAKITMMMKPAIEAMNEMDDQPTYMKKEKEKSSLEQCIDANIFTAEIEKDKKTSSSTDPFSLLCGIYNNTHDNEPKLNEEIRYPTLTDILKPDYNPDDWYITESEYQGRNSKHYSVNGKFLNKQQLEQYEYIEQMKAAGYTTAFIMKGLNKSGDNPIRDMLKQEQKLSKKEKKRMKKAKKHINSSSEEHILDTINNDLGGNFDSYQEYVDSMLNMDSPDFFTK